jgi:membrane-associated protease RseP (regulator of RpoE activity)
MSIMQVDITLFVAFCVFVVLFLWLRRSRVDREGIIFLYRTKFGIGTIEKLAKKLKWLWQKLGPVIIVAGFIFMIAMIWLLIESIWLTFKVPMRTPPIMPLVPYLPQAFKMPLPPFYFTYWILIIAIVAITHECAHGIFSRLYKLKVKSTGFGFLGPFLVAFVEPDEKKLVKKSRKAQMQILGAGSASNMLFAVIFMLVMQLFFVAAYQPAGLAYDLSYSKLNFSDINGIGNYSADGFLNLSDKEDNTYWMTPDLIKTIPFYKKSIIKQQAIVAYDNSAAFKANLSGGLISVDGQKIKSAEQLSEIMSTKKPGETVSVETSEKSYDIILDPSKTDPEQGMIGVAMTSKTGVRAFFSRLTAPYFSPDIVVKARGNEQATTFFADLLLWLVLICFFVALFNMLPVGFLDGGKFMYLAALSVTKSKKKAENVFKIASWIVALIFIFLILAWLVGL